MIKCQYLFSKFGIEVKFTTNGIIRIIRNFFSRFLGHPSKDLISVQLSVKNDFMKLIQSDCDNGDCCFNSVTQMEVSVVYIDCH